MLVAFPKFQTLMYHNLVASCSKEAMIFQGGKSLLSYLLTYNYNKIKVEITEVWKRIKHKQTRPTGDMNKEAFNTVVRTWS